MIQPYGYGKYKYGENFLQQWKWYSGLEFWNKYYFQSRN